MSSLFRIYINDILSVAQQGVYNHLLANECVFFKDMSRFSNQVSLNATLKEIIDWCTLWDGQVTNQIYYV